MTGNNFNTAVSVLTVGYVLMQIPSNMLLTRVRPSLYLSTCALAWSLISSMSTQHDWSWHVTPIDYGLAFTGFASSYGSLLACRFLLGFFEAPVSHSDTRVEP
jgi:MFS family permease